MPEPLAISPEARAAAADGPLPLTDAAAHAAAAAAGATTRRTPCGFPGFRGMDCVDPAFVRGQNGYGAQKDACLRHGTELRNWLRALGGGRITAIEGATEAVRRGPV
jgi:hypothetical protein